MNNKKSIFAIILSCTILSNASYASNLTSSIINAETCNSGICLHTSTLPDGKGRWIAMRELDSGFEFQRMYPHCNAPSTSIYTRMYIDYPEPDKAAIYQLYICSDQSGTDCDLLEIKDIKINYILNPNPHPNTGKYFGIGTPRILTLDLSSVKDNPKYQTCLN